MRRTTPVRSHFAQHVAAACVAVTVAVACGKGGDRAGNDSTQANAGRANAPAPGVAAQTANAGKPPTKTCDNVDAGTKTPTVSADLSSKNPSANDQAAVVKYITDQAICFAHGNGQAHDDFTPPSGKSLKLTIRSEWRMPKTDPKSDIAKGDGMVVAEIQNHEQGNDYPAQWDSPLANEGSAYMWFGVDKNGARYSRLFTVSDWSKGEIKMISDGKGSASWEHYDFDHDDKARAHWNPQHKVLKPQFLQPNGSGWIACLAGCCTALSLNSV